LAPQETQWGWTRAGGRECTFFKRSQIELGLINAGLGGGAARVVLPKGQPIDSGEAAEAAADGTLEPTSSGEKRKAEAEAQTASVKRRPSPEPEVIFLRTRSGLQKACACPVSVRVHHCLEATWICVESSRLLQSRAGQCSELRRRIAELTCLMGLLHG
jgi:hypothetical protein